MPQRPRQLYTKSYYASHQVPIHFPNNKIVFRVPFIQGQPYNPHSVYSTYYTVGFKGRRLRLNITEDGVLHATKAPDKIMATTSNKPVMGSLYYEHFDLGDITTRLPALTSVSSGIVDLDKSILTMINKELYRELKAQMAYCFSIDNFGDPVHYFALRFDTRIGLPQGAIPTCSWGDTVCFGPAPPQVVFNWVKSFTSGHWPPKHYFLLDRKDIELMMAKGTHTVNYALGK